jgi:hypothetical protein
MVLRHLSAVLLAISLLAGCAIPIDEQATDLVAELPDALLPPASTTSEAPAATESVQIYMARLTDDDRMLLEVVDREIAGDGSINVILDKVLAGPTAAEHESEFISPFAEGSAVIGTVLMDGLLEIHLDSLDGFPQDDSAGNRLAFAMLVCTAVNLVAGAEIDRVVILLENVDGLEAINVPVSDGDPPEEGAPVTCGNYVGFLSDGLTDPGDPEPPSDS